MGRFENEFRPLHDRILIKRLEEAQQVRGGIIIPDSAKEKPQQGEVKAVGNGKLLESNRPRARWGACSERFLIHEGVAKFWTKWGYDRLCIRAWL
jgi:hypothetical protein